VVDGVNDGVNDGVADRRGDDDAQSDALPATSTSALSFGLVREALPAGVTLSQTPGTPTSLSFALTLRRQGGTVFGMSFLGGAYLAMQVPVAEFAFPIVVGCVLLGAYSGLTMAFGTREVVIDDEHLVIRTRPVFFGDTRVRRDRIDRLEIVPFGKRAGVRSFTIVAVVDGRDRVLVTDLRSARQARVIAVFLAQQLRLDDDVEVRAVP
jgi:hypothetical protein